MELRLSRSSQLKNERPHFHGVCCGTSESSTTKRLVHLNADLLAGLYETNNNELLDVLTPRNAQMSRLCGWSIA